MDPGGARTRWATPSVVLFAVVLVGLNPAASVVDAPGNNAATVDESVPLLGYTDPGTVDLDLLDGLQRVVEAYSGPGKGPVFDFTNSPGYFYYLLGEELPTRYYHVSMAMPEFSQRQAIVELERSRPALVVYDGTIGLPGWDGPRNGVRHFLLSQYLLEGWQPLLSAQGVLFLLRNDLMEDRPPPPALVHPPELTELHFAAPACDFGYSANYLTSEPREPAIDLEVSPAVAARRVRFSGWVHDAARHESAREVLLVVGGRAVASFTATIGRPDVAALLADPDAVASGFLGGWTTSHPGRATIYAVLGDGLAHPVGDPVAVPPSELQRPDGSEVPVAEDPAVGSVESVVEERVQLSVATLPGSDALKAYQLLTIGSGDGDLGRTTVTISNSRYVTVGRDRRIRFRVLPVAGADLSARVGSCLQWHGFGNRKLYLTYTGGQAIDAVTLSAVS